MFTECKKKQNEQKLYTDTYRNLGQANKPMYVITRFDFYFHFIFVYIQSIFTDLFLDLCTPLHIMVL